MYLIEVYVTNSSLNVNRPFTYVYDKPLQKYVRVKVLFNRSQNIAIVVSCKETDKTREEIDRSFGFKVREITEVIDEEPVISDEIFELATWLSKTTISPFISCLNAMLPKALKTSKSLKGPKMLHKLHKIEEDFTFTKRQREIYDLIDEGMLAAEARKMSASIVNKLISIGALTEYEEEAQYENADIERKGFKTLTAEQQNAYDRIISTEQVVSLLFGVTGSGKTEVYLHLADYYLKQNKEVLIMVPEISLTPQMIERVKERFNDVIFYHSELSDQERYEQYMRVKEGEVRIIVGTRSSVFLPFHDLGIIIIDEEHDSSYKQDNIPCYHARNVAIKRAITHHAKVLLASATPSLDSYSRALKKEYQLLELKNRINLNLPEINVIDLTKQLRKKDSYIISEPLKQAISETLDNNKQVIILLNRRGYSPIIKCAECGTTLMCQDCDTPLNYHKDENVLKCHQCSRTYNIPKSCPSCGGNKLIYYGFGTKRVEEELVKMFPNAHIDRMDRDSVNHKGAHSQILKTFEKHQTDILIGTQMIAKGLDYPDVTLVGILNADAGLMHQDYNSAKMTFDLLMQASGRSGRADSMGKVIIQAFNVDHYAIKAVISHDYSYFYNIEMNYRQKTAYPPYSHLIEIILSDMNERRLQDSLSFVSHLTDQLAYKVYRPYRLPKQQKLERYRILIMGKNIRDMLNDMQMIVDRYIAENNLSHIKIDIDPLYLE
ncbi:MAG: primosomal protein N' [Erysipelotrichaceae bacterium]|nr:primosomal protein N' [Erysipelotrichaceae bacterium]